MGVRQSEETREEEIGRLYPAEKTGHASTIAGFLSMHMTYFYNLIFYELKQRTRSGCSHGSL